MPTRANVPKSSATPGLDAAGQELTDAELEAVVGGLERVFVAYKKTERSSASIEHGLAPP